MLNYFIIGGDGKEYGPITEGNIRQWLAEGRLNAQTSVRTDADANWRPLGTFAEFADIFQTPPTIAPPPSSESFSSQAGPANMDFAERDYELDLGGCVSRGWHLVMGNLGLFFVGALIYLAIQGAMGMLGNIPIVGGIFSIANLVISGPLMGGVLWMFLRGVRGEPGVEVGDVFAGFKRSFGQLFLATLVQGLLIGIVMLPFIVVFIYKLVNSGMNLDPHHLQGLENNPEAAQALVKDLLGIGLVTLPVLLLCAVPAVYLGTCWKFSLPLIMDKRLEFWPAMKTSMKMVNKHWWQVFGLVLLVGLLNLAGFIACCVGLLFTIPVGFAAMMIAYDTIFGERQN